MDSNYSIPDGFSSPLAIVTPQDHAAWIYIAALLGLCCFLLFGGVRLLVRSMFTGSFGNDDYFYCAATVIAIIQTAIILGACSKGLGKSVNLLTQGAQEEVQRLYYTSNLLFVVAVGLTKMSVIAFLHRTSRMRSHRIVFNSATAVVVAYVIGSIFALALQCDTAEPWISVGAECRGAVSVPLLLIHHLHPNTEAASTMAGDLRPGYSNRSRHHWSSRLPGLRSAKPVI